MIEHHLFTRLGPLVGGRLFPGVAPEGAQRPYIAYTVVGQPVDFTLAGADGLGQANIQLTCWSADHVEALQLAQALLEEATRTEAPGFDCAGAQRIPDSHAAGLYGIGWEFTFEQKE